MGRARRFAHLTVFLLAAAPAALAETAARPVTLGLMIGDSSAMTLGQMLVRDVSHEHGVRLVPMIGSGSVLSLHDLAAVPGVDAALVSSDAMAYARAHGLVRDPGRYAALARLKPLELILVARRDLADLSSLNGQRIATGPAGSAAYASGELVFSVNTVQFQRVPLAGQDGLRALAEGRADAALVLGRDTDFTVLQEANRAGGGFHVLALPFAEALANTHSPVLIPASALPGLLAPGSDVESVAAALIVAVREPARGTAAFDRLRRFSRALYASPEATAAGNNPAARVPGWKASAAAAEARSGSHGNLPRVTAATPEQGDHP